MPASPGSGRASLLRRGACETHENGALGAQTRGVELAQSKLRPSDGVLANDRASELDGSRERGAMIRAGLR